MRRYPSLKALFPALAMIILVGCTNQGYLQAPSLQSLARQTATDEPQTFDVVGPVAVDVDSFGGNVTIIANDKLTNATVQVTRDARHGFMRGDEAEASLSEIDYSADLVNRESGQVLEVKTWTDHDQPYQQRAHVRIAAPSITDVHVRTSHGMVHAQMIHGAVDIETTDGDVRVMTNMPMTKRVTILNQDGDIDYRVRGESTARFDAHAIRGKVLQRVRNGRMVILPSTDDDTLIATLNEGTNPVTLRTVDGQIRIAVVPEPTKVGAMIVTP